MISQLKSIDRFSFLPEPLLHELAESGRIVTYKKGEPLFFEGDACSNLYVIVTGAVKIAKTLESGRELIMDILGPGEGVGEVALLDELPFPAKATAHVETRVYVLSAERYFSLLGEHPELARAIIRDLASRLRTINRRMKDVSGGNVEYRIAHLLLTLGQRVGVEEKNTLRVNMALSRQEIADMVGTTIETTIRIMSRWAKEGVVTTSATGFEVKALARLREIAEGSL